MGKSSCAFVCGLFLALSAAAPPVSAQQAYKEAGVGVIAGDPIGGTAKIWFDESHALDLGVGFSGDVVFWGDLLWHAWNLLPQPRDGKLGAYLGVGPRLEAAPDAEFGVRTVAGASWRLSRQPIELFAEAGPLFRVAPESGVGADGGVGVRVYFGSAAGPPTGERKPR
ncbi:MAG: hypothetical protein HY403_08745 [Elusimicrobia bacterium]|nr:hypothetical protein [Elusimicrobiota bacterium]